MSDDSRELLDRIRVRQYGSSDPLDVADALADIGSAPRQAIPDADRLQQFLSRLQINGISLEVASSRSEVVKRIGRFVYREHNTHRVVAGQDQRLAALPWRDAGVLVRFGAAGADDPVSISYARFGVAETGSLLMYCNRDNPAANNWLTQDHIVILDGKDLVTHLEDAWQGIREDQSLARLPRGISFISGPSATSDIQGHRVVGAHGPQRLRLIYLGLLEDELLLRTGHPARDAI